MIPNKVRAGIQESLWLKADKLDWPRLSQIEKARWYRIWTEDPEVGGILGNFMDPRKVRVYIKDTLLKPYNRSRLPDQSALFELLQIAKDEPVTETFIKPHGRLLTDGRVICWGPAANWKAVVLAVFERAFRINAIPYAAILIGADDHLPDIERQLAKAVASKLGVQFLRWRS